MQNASHPPVLLVIAGNDPSGGAGLTADIQAATALGTHPAPVVAALTVQDSRNVLSVQPVEPAFVVAQARAVLEDMPVTAIKLGLLASAAVGEALASLLKEYPGIALVIDPVLAASGGTPLAEGALLQVYLKKLFPLATIITPNASESHRLAPQAVDIETRGAALLKTGARHVLIKGGDEDTPDVRNHLFSIGEHKEFTWPRLPGHFHGSGCTLASAIAALLATGAPLPTAIAEAQRYTWKTLKRSWKLSDGQRIPNRHDVT